VENGVCNQVDIRRAPPTGTGNMRWEELGDLLSDCIACSWRASGLPPPHLQARGLRVLEPRAYPWANLVPMAAAGGQIRRLGKPFRCGDGCLRQGPGLRLTFKIQRSPHETPNTHLLVCASFRMARQTPRGSATRRAPATLLAYLETELSDRDLEGVTVTATGCLKVCREGPVMIVHPETSGTGGRDRSGT